MKCVNITHPDFKKLVKDTNINSFMLEVRIKQWQEEHNTNDFPTSDVILNYIPKETLGGGKIVGEIKPGVSELFESNPELANAVYEALGFKSKPDVILPIGTSGSGKSTFIKSLPQENLVVIEPDAMRVEFTGDMNDKSKDKEIYEEAAKRAVQAVKNGKQVVFDTTNLTKDKRRPFIEAIKKEIPNANIQYKLMELNPELAKQRIKAQLERGENRAAVSDATIDRHAESFKQMLEDIKNEPISNFEITLQQKQQAQQLYSQYLESLNKPNTNPVLQGNQQIIGEKLGILKTSKEKYDVLENLTYEEFLKLDKNEIENILTYHLHIYPSNKPSVGKPLLFGGGYSEPPSNFYPELKFNKIFIKYEDGQFNLYKNKIDNSGVAKLKNENSLTEEEEDKLLSEELLGYSRFNREWGLHEEDISSEDLSKFIQYSGKLEKEIYSEEDYKKAFDWWYNNERKRLDNPKVTTKRQKEIDDYVQQEQLNKFKELQERLNNKEFLEGAKFAYESSEGLKSFDAKGITLGEEDGGGWKKIKLNGKNIGEVKLVKNDRRSKEVGLSIKINDDYKNKGYGQIVHILVADWAKNEFGDTLYSDFQNSKEEIQLLEALVKKGYAEKIGSYGEASKEYPDNFNTEERAFRIKTSDELSKNLTQQSQSLKDFGTQEQYNDYIARVSLGITRNPTSGKFNSSAVKDIVYHFGEVGKNKKFSNEFAQIDSGINRKGFQFATSIKTLLEYGISGLNRYLKNGKYDDEQMRSDDKLQAVLLNTTNPFIDKNLGGELTTTNDAYARLDYNNNGKYIVFEPEQIHLLGSKQDIEGFKESVEGKNKLFQESGSLATLSQYKIDNLQNTVEYQLLNEKDEDLDKKVGQSYMFLSKKDAERFTYLVEKNKEFPKEFKVTKKITKYEKDSKNPLKYKGYNEYTDFYYIKSNKNKKSNLYDIVNKETGEVIASKVRVLSVSKDSKSEIAKKYGLEHTPTKVFSANRSIAFALYRQKPSKAKYIAQAKKYLYDAIKFLNPEETNLKINLDKIEELLSRFPEEMWDYINTTHSPEDSTNINASISLQNEIKFNLPKLGFLQEIEKITGIKLLGTSFKNYDRTGSLAKVFKFSKLNGEWGSTIIIDNSMTTKELKASIRYYLSTKNIFKPTTEEENVRKYAEHGGIDYNKLRELVFGDLDKALDNIAFNTTGNSDTIELSKWRESIRNYDWQSAELFSKPYENFQNTVKERIIDKFKDKNLSNGISHLEYFFNSDAFNWLNINFNNISGQYYLADMETEATVGVETKMGGIINPFEMKIYQKPKAGENFLQEKEVFNRLAAILHEPFHALHALSYGTKEELELRKAFDNLYNTTFGKEMMNQIFGSGYNKGQQISYDTLYKEFTAFTTQLMLYPKQWIKNTDLRSNDIYEFIEKIQTLQDKTYEEVVRTQQKIGTTEKTITEEEQIKLSFLEKLYNYLVKALNKIIPLSKQFTNLIADSKLVEKQVIEDVFGTVEETVTKTLKLPENVKKSKEQFLGAMEELQSAINTLMQIDGELFSSENVTDFFTNNKFNQEEGSLSNFISQKSQKNNSFLQYNNSNKSLQQIKDERLDSYSHKPSTTSNIIPITNNIVVKKDSLSDEITPENLYEAIKDIVHKKSEKEGEVYEIKGDKTTNSTSHTLAFIKNRGIIEELETLGIIDFKNPNDKNTFSFNLSGIEAQNNLIKLTSTPENKEEEKEIKRIWDSLDYDTQVKINKIRESKRLKPFPFSGEALFSKKKTSFSEMSENSKAKREEELVAKLNAWASKNGISVEVVRSILERKGVDASGLALIMRDLILLNENTPAEIFAEEVAHFIIEMLGDSNPSVKKAIELIKQTDFYQEIKAQYEGDPNYSSENKIAKEAIGQLMAARLVGRDLQIKETEKVKPFLQAIWEKFLTWLKILKRNNPNAITELETLISGFNQEILEERKTMDVRQKMANITNESYSHKTPSVKKAERLKKAAEQAVEAIKNRIMAQNKIPNISSEKIAKNKEFVDKLESSIIKAKSLDNELMEAEYLSIISTIVVRMGNSMAYYYNDGATSQINTNDGLVQKALKGEVLTAQEFSSLKNFYTIFNGVVKNFKLIKGLDIETQEILNEFVAKLDYLGAFIEDHEELHTINFINQLNTDESGAEIITNLDTEELVVDDAFVKSAKWSFRWFIGNYKNSKFPLVKLLMRKLKFITYDVQRQAMDTARKLFDLQKAAEKDGFKVQSLYQMKDGNYTGNLIAEYDYHQYYNDLDKVVLGYVNKEGFKTLAEFYKEASDAQKHSLVVLKNKWLTENTTYNDTDWHPNKKYYNPEFKNVVKTPAIKAYYNAIINQRKSDLEKLPKRYNKKKYLYAMPQIKGDWIDRLRLNQEGFMSRVGQWIKEGIYKPSEDETQFGDMFDKYKSVPIFFLSKLKDPNEISKDLTASTVAFSEMANNYSQMMGIAADSEILLEVMKEKEFHKRDSKGRVIDTTLGSETAQVKMVETMIDAFVYGIKKDRDNPEASLITQKIVNYVRNNNLAFHLVSALTGYLRAETETVIEGRIKLYTTNASNRWAFLEAAKRTPKILANSGNRMIKDKLFRMMEDNAVIDSIRASYSMLHRKGYVHQGIMDGDIMYLGFRATDFILKSKVSLAIYHNTRLVGDKFMTYNQFIKANLDSKLSTKAQAAQRKELAKQWKTFADKNLWEAFDEDYKVKPEFAKYVTSDLLNATRARIEELAHRVDSTMDELDKGELARRWYGDLFLLHRGFLIQGIDNRLKGIKKSPEKRKGFFKFIPKFESEARLNVETGVEEIGYYAATLGYLEKAFEDGKFSIPHFVSAWNQLSDLEKKGVKRTVLDLTIALAVSVLAAMAMAAADDEPEDPAMQFMALIMVRYMAESTAFIDPRTFVEISDEPIMVSRQFKEISELFAVLVEANKELQSGPYKGFTKLEKYAFKRLWIKNLYELGQPKEKRKAFHNLFAKGNPVYQGTYNELKD